MSNLHAFIGSCCSFLLKIMKHGLNSGHKHDHVVANKLGQSPCNVGNKVESGNLGLELGGAKSSGEGGKQSEKGRAVSDHFAKCCDGVFGGDLNLALLVAECLQYEGKLCGYDGFNCSNTLELITWFYGCNGERKK